MLPKIIRRIKHIGDDLSKFELFRYGNSRAGKTVDYVLSKLEDIFYYNPIIAYTKISRSIAFAILGWGSYDWDSHYLIEVMQFKMKRIRVALINGIAVLEKNEIKSLDLAIKIGDRIMEDKYFRYNDMHSKKWGELVTTYTPYSRENISGSVVSFSRPKANTEEEIEQEKKENREAYLADEREKSRDIKLYFTIISKYYQYWWE